MFKFTSKKTNYDFTNEVESLRVIGNCVVSDKVESLSGQVFKITDGGDTYVANFYYNEMGDSYTKNITDVNLANGVEIEDVINNTIKEIKNNHDSE